MNTSLIRRWQFRIDREVLEFRFPVRLDGSGLSLDPIASVEMGIADVFVIETPGGGGFGAPV